MNQRWKIRQAVKALHHGGIIAYPTEAVYGLGCDPWNMSAVYRLLEMKQRPWQKGLILIAANFNQLQEFIAPVSADVLQRLEATWPGDITWLLPANENTPKYLTGLNNTIAVRVTAHKQTIELCRAFDSALVSTSANISGSSPAKNQRHVQWHLHNLDALLTGSCSGNRNPTVIRDAQTGERIR